jgi:hypothetical protein
MTNYSLLKLKNYKSKKLYLRYFPIKVDNSERDYSEDEINTMIKKDLTWMYKNGNASMKLNIDILFVQIQSMYLLE